MKISTYLIATVSAGLLVFCSYPVAAEEFTASGTWSAGGSGGKWGGTLSRDGNFLGGRVRLAGGPVSVADVAGTVVGERIELSLISGKLEIASFDGTVSLEQLGGTVTMADGTAGKWAGTWQLVAGVDAPITSSRPGTLTAPWDRVPPAPTSVGDVCDLLGSDAAGAMSSGGLMALRSRCQSRSASSSAPLASSTSISCGAGSPESNPPTPPSVTGALVNTVARPLQTWPHITQSETSAVVSLVDNRKETISYNDIQFLNTFGGIGFGYRALSPGAWTQNGNQLSVPTANGVEPFSDPSGAPDRLGNFKLSYISLELGCGNLCVVPGIGSSTSTNGGFTYDTTERAIAPFSLYVSRDKEWLAVDWTTNTATNTQYLCWTDFTSCGSNCATTRIWFARRRPTDLTFSSPVALSDTLTYPAIAQGCQVAVASDSSVYAVWLQGFNLAQSSIIGTRLADGITPGPLFDTTGTFIQPYSTSATNDCGTPALTGHIRVEPFPSLAINRQTNAVNIAWNRRSASSSHNSEIAFVRSTNQGASWSTPIVASDATSGDKFMPAVAHSTAEGAIKIMWYDRRNDSANVSIDLYSAISTNGGATFSANSRVTAAPFGVPHLWPVNFDCVASDYPLPGPSACYMGDYNSLANLDPRPGQTGGFLHAWGDNSLKFPDPDDNLNVPDPDVRAFSSL